MWMSNIYIMVSQNNHDRNTLGELCTAVTETGATIIAIDEHNLMIEAATPAHEVPTIAAMEGVKYVRCIFTYVVDPLRQGVAA
jgi:hypothetical protein